MQVQAVVDPSGLVTQTEPTFFEKPVEMPSNVQSMDTLHANPMIQRLVEERVAGLESKMRAELQQDTTHRRKSGHYNTAETPHSAPHLRWPNESCLTGTQRKRTPFDDFSLSQFVVGYINNVLETQYFDMVKHMLTELCEMVKLADNLTYLQSAVFCESVTMSPKPPGSPQVAGGTKKIVCKWFNKKSVETQ